MKKKVIAVLALGVVLSGCSAQERQRLEELRINKEYSPFRECTAWAAKVLGEDASAAEHLELTNSCLIMKRKGGAE